MSASAEAKALEATGSEAGRLRRARNGLGARMSARRAADAKALEATASEARRARNAVGARTSARRRRGEVRRAGRGRAGC